MKTCKIAASRATTVTHSGAEQNIEEWVDLLPIAEDTLAYPGPCAQVSVSVERNISLERLAGPVCRFEMVRVNVAVTLPCVPSGDALSDAYARCVEFADEGSNAYVAELEKQFE